MPNDFILTVEAKIIAKPVTPKTGLGARGPFERNLFVVKDSVKVFYYGTKASLATYVANALKAMSRQWGLLVAEPAQGYTLPATSITSTTVTLNGMVHSHAVSTAVTFEYGTTPALGTSVAAAESPFSTDAYTAMTLARTGLSASTQYYYRLKMISAGVTIWSDLATFKTAAT